MPLKRKSTRHSQHATDTEMNGGGDSKEVSNAASATTLKDDREPKITFFSHLKVFKVIGLWNLTLLSLGVIGSMAYGVLPIICQYILGDLIDDFLAANSNAAYRAEAINQVCIKLTIITFCGMAAFGLYHFFLQLSNHRIGTALRQAYMDALTRQEMSFFDIKKVGALTVVLSEDIPKIQDVYTNEFYIFMQEIIQFIVGFILAITTNWKMTLILVSTTPLTYVSHTIMSLLSTKITRQVNRLTEHSAGVANEITSCIRTIRSMAGESKEMERFNQDLYKINTKGVFKGTVHAMGFSFAAMFVWGTIALSFWYSGHEAANGGTTLGSIFKVFGMMFVGVVAMIRAATFFPHYGKAYASETTLLKVLLRDPAIPLSGGKTIEHIEGNIRFENVEFSYPSRSNVIVMKDFNLEIKKGQTVALVGPSGSGKSTLVGLLERFYTPNKGRVFLDNIDIQELDPTWLHHNIGIVSQEPVLFSGSIKYNIAYALGLENVTQEQVESAAKQANAHNFIIDLPNGYETILGEKGVSLSGGQKQRIAIARALLQNPKMLDEATSALDSESERLVQAALDVLMKGRTTICIAHRLTTVINSDLICVMVKGILREKGSHSQLIQIKGGIYRNLAAKQMMLAEEHVSIDRDELDIEETMDLVVDDEQNLALESSQDKLHKDE
ncbi:hypothetical protein C9374_011645 [Naegleria lovaniensis]|uniref:Uncharacterized protein n=1 Tax=Naegleria lovaniensis TaxID=51637 RepID=A0AA88G9M8_NAELO|nr:uncharacterized protein C9374_011645 [Naegleria lovaniensis]KAG2373980.1 hypothetical protein C9374_011645 [Naegleria lovaniensis]